MIRKGGGEAKRHKKPQKSHKRNVGNGADLGGGRKYIDNQQISSCHSHKTRRPSETVVTCGAQGPRDRRRWTGSGRPEERRRRTRNPGRVKRNVGNKVDLVGLRTIICEQEYFISRCQPRTSRE